MADEIVTLTLKLDPEKKDYQANQIGKLVILAPPGITFAILNPAGLGERPAVKRSLIRRILGI